MCYLYRLTVCPLFTSLRRLSPGPLCTYTCLLLLLLVPTSLRAQAVDLTHTASSLQTPHQSLQQTIAALESSGDFWHPQIAESTASLGMLLQQEGRHQEALEALERAAQIHRVNHGIFSLEQTPLLVLQVNSLLVLDQWEKADQLMREHFYIHVRTAPPSSPELVRALDTYASWHLRAYMENRVQQPVTRLVDAYQLHRLIIKNLQQQTSHDAQTLEHYLRQMTFIAWRLNRTVSVIPSGILFDSGRQVNDQWVETLAADVFRVRNNTLLMGEAALQTLVDSVQRRLAAAEGSPQARQLLQDYARTRLDLADWYLNTNVRRKALEEYRQIWEELDNKDPALALEMLNNIVVLPAYDYVISSDASTALVSATRIRSAAPISVHDHTHWEWAEIEFDLNRYGDVTEASVRSASEELDDEARHRLVSVLKGTLLRPIMSAAGTVERDGLVHRFYYHRDISGQRQQEDTQSDEEDDLARAGAIETALSEGQ